MTDTVTTTTPATETKPWYEGKADAETVGYFQNRGWDKKDAVTVALEASAAHRAAEKLIGAPADQMIRLPKPEDAVAVKAMWQRLGAPADAKDYKFDGIKFADGTELDQKFTDFLRTSFGELHLPQDRASRIAQSIVKYMDAEDAREAADTAATLKTEQDALAKNWGTNSEAFKLVARNTALNLGIDPAAVQALEKLDKVGFAKVMDMFYKIGQKTGEDKFITNNFGGGAGGIMTREAAIARKAELKRDVAWVNRYLNGDTEAKKEMTSLDTIIVGVKAA